MISANADESKNNSAAVVSCSASDECLESPGGGGSMPDADLNECLATATEALTEILVKSNNENKVDIDDDTNGNAPLLTAVKHLPNVSSSSTQTDCPPSSSCCCNEWNCWKSAEDHMERRNGGTVQCQSNRCCHHRRKKPGETTQDSNICECDATKYSKSWRELRKSTTNKRSNVLCRFQNCGKRNSVAKPA